MLFRQTLSLIILFFISSSLKAAPTLGPSRLLARGPMFPVPVFRDSEKNITLCSAKAEESLGRYFMFSKDNGVSWSEDPTGFTFKDEMCGPATIVTQNHKTMAFHWEVKPSLVDPDFYVSKFELDPFKKRYIGPLQSKFILPKEFPRHQPYWFHGNIIQLPNQTLMAPIQMGDFTVAGYHFKLLIFSSADEGLTWTYTATVGGWKDTKNIFANGYQTFGPVEANLQYLADGKMLVVARIVNDDLLPPLTKPLNKQTHPQQLDGKYITGGLPGKYYDLGPDQPPLVMSRSNDNGKTWSAFTAIPESHGVFPRMAFNADKSILLLSYGALKYPRWGNAIQYSMDSGKSWSSPLIISKNFTSGYSDIVVDKDNSFQIFYDITPPQPAFNHADHSINTVRVSFPKK